MKGLTISFIVKELEKFYLNIQTYIPVYNNVQNLSKKIKQ